MNSQLQDGTAGHPCLAISSVFGAPRDRATWSAAPAAVADELERRGFDIVGVNGSVGRASYISGGIIHLLSGYGGVRYSEAISRGTLLRRRRAARILAELQRHRVTQVLHTGTLDLPPDPREEGIRHFLYCDSTWDLSLRHRPDAALYTPRAVAAFDRLEQDAYRACDHIFTFGHYVRDNLVSHYGIPAERVTAAGSGCGQAEPYLGEKDYTRGDLLFVAKHLFKEKGGELLLEAFPFVRAHRPDVTLTIVGGASGLEAGALPPHVRLMPFVDRDELTALMRRATLVVQPMLNDPWGQVYLEALLARTPVIGLDRNGLPEITRNGRHGFLVGEPSPEALARTVLDALSDPVRLEVMGRLGQQHVLESYSWQRVADSMAAVFGPAPTSGIVDRAGEQLPPEPSTASPVNRVANKGSEESIGDPPVHA